MSLPAKIAVADQLCSTFLYAHPHPKCRNQCYTTISELIASLCLNDPERVLSKRCTPKPKSVANGIRTTVDHSPLTLATHFSDFPHKHLPFLCTCSYASTTFISVPERSLPVHDSAKSSSEKKKKKFLEKFQPGYKRKVNLQRKYFLLHSFVSYNNK